jgi:hypothetical protein
MPEQYPAPPTGTQLTKITHPLTLAPLADGPGALDPGNTELIQAVFLRRLETIRRGMLPKTTTKEGKNLFATAAPAPTPVPRYEDRPQLPSPSSSQIPPPPKLPTCESPTPSS